MTTKQIWRLKEQPTTESLRELVKDGILTKDEARAMLFSVESDEDRDKKSLEAEVKFLRELVEKLSDNRAKIVETIRYIEKPYTRYEWLHPYAQWCSTDSGIGAVTSSASLNYVADGTNNTLYAVGSGSTNGSAQTDFTSIKTF